MDLLLVVDKKQCQAIDCWCIRGAARSERKRSHEKVISGDIPSSVFFFIVHVSRVEMTQPCASQTCSSPFWLVDPFPHQAAQPDDDVFSVGHCGHVCPLRASSSGVGGSIAGARTRDESLRLLEMKGPKCVARVGRTRPEGDVAIVSIVLLRVSLCRVGASYIPPGRLPFGTP